MPNPLNPTKASDSHTDWLIFSRIAWVRRLLPVIACCTVIYLAFLVLYALSLAPGIDTSKHPVVLTGYASLMQLIALPMLQFAMTKNNSLYIVFLCANGGFIFSLAIILIYTYASKNKSETWSNCPIDQLLTFCFLGSTSIVELLIFSQRKAIRKVVLAEAGHHSPQSPIMPTPPAESPPSSPPPSPPTTSASPSPPMSPSPSPPPPPPVNPKSQPPSEKRPSKENAA